MRCTFEVKVIVKIVRLSFVDRSLDNKIMTFTSSTFEKNYKDFFEGFKKFMKYVHANELDAALVTISQLARCTPHREGDEVVMPSGSEAEDFSPTKHHLHVSEEDWKSLFKRLEHSFKYHFWRLDKKVRLNQARSLCSAIRVPTDIQKEWHL